MIASRISYAWSGRDNAPWPTCWLLTTSAPSANCWKSVSARKGIGSKQPRTDEAAEAAARRRKIFDIVDFRYLHAGYGRRGTPAVLAKKSRPSTIFILITGVPTVDTAIDAVNFGADRYVVKGDRLLDELRPAVQQVAENLALKQGSRLPAARVCAALPGWTTLSAPARRCEPIFDLIETIAPQSSRVLITGESGTGKELVGARHSRKQRTRARLRLSRSIAARSLKPCWNRNSSATCAAHSRARTKIATDYFRLPTAERCSWTRSAT